MTRAARSTILAYCEVRRGIGHWTRLRAVASALSRRFDVVAAVTTEVTGLTVPGDVRLVCFPAGAHFPCNGYSVDAGDSGPAVSRALGGHLIALVERMRPAAVLLEYFPFGRDSSAVYLVPFLESIRRASSPPAVVTSLRDIGERTDDNQDDYNRRAVRMANRLVDAVLVHSDPRVLALGDTFALARELTMPVSHTGYVVPAFAPAARRAAPSRRIVVSAGSGRGSMALLRLAIAAHRTGLWRDFTMRLFGGQLLSDEEWREVQALAAPAAWLELVRWTPNLAEEMAAAAVSVSRAGYNTVLDVVRARVPAVAVPFVPGGDDEQALRACAFERLGVLRRLDEAGLTPERLAAAIREAEAAGASPAPRIALDGTERTVECLEAILERRLAGPASPPAARRPSLRA